MKVDVGLDIGFGATKVVTESAQLVFPSVCGAAINIRFNGDEARERYPGDQIVDDEGDWFVGDLALKQVPNAELIKLRARTTDESTFSNEFRVRMMKAAIGKLFPGMTDGDTVHLNIATGLPVSYMGDTAALKDALVGQHHVKTDTTEFVLNVGKVMVMPQPYGTIYDQSLTNKGKVNPCHTATRTAVVDVGTYTVDLTVDDSMEYIENESDSLEIGTHTAQQRLIDWYSDKYRQKPTYKQVEDALLTGCLIVRGQEVDVYEIVQDALKPLINGTLALATRLWQAGANLDVIYVSGGGAQLVYETLLEIYPQVKLVELPQFANARGYLNYALSKRV
jgi:plasmid segregation protein ParM